MTKIHRQPKQPKPARVTLADVKKLAGELGSELKLNRFRLPPVAWSAWTSLDHARYIHVEHPSRSAALRIMHAALVAMRKEQK